MVSEHSRRPRSSQRSVRSIPLHMGKLVILRGEGKGREGEGGMEVVQWGTARWADGGDGFLWWMLLGVSVTKGVGWAHS